MLAREATQGRRSLITLETRGRVSGRPHRVVVPVLTTGSRMFAVSSYGGQSDWWKNAMADPTVRVTRLGAPAAGTLQEVSFGELRRTLRVGRTQARTGWMERGVRLAFLVRARISGHVAEIVIRPQA